jgi:hypothetical protein
MSACGLRMSSPTIEMFGGAVEANASGDVPP